MTWNYMDMLIICSLNAILIYFIVLTNRMGSIQLYEL